MHEVINNYQKHNLSLGQALAYLRAEKMLERPLEGLAEADKFYLNSLRNRKHRSDDPKYFKQLLEQIYARPTTLDNTFDDMHTDFFLELFLTDSDDRDCMRLAMKLNDHFDHFEYFSEVLRDFLNKYDRLMDGNYVS